MVLRPWQRRIQFHSSPKIGNQVPLSSGHLSVVNFLIRNEINNRLINFNLHFQINHYLYAYLLGKTISAMTTPSRMMLWSIVIMVRKSSNGSLMKWVSFSIWRRQQHIFLVGPVALELDPEEKTLARLWFLLGDRPTGMGQILSGLFKFMKMAMHSFSSRIPESTGEDAKSSEVMDKKRISLMISFSTCNVVWTQSISHI